MADRTVTRTLIIKGSAPGVDQATAAVKGLAKEYENFVVVSETTSKRMLSMEDVLKRRERQFVAGVREAQEFAKVQRDMNAAVAQNPALQERANVVLQQAAARLNIVGTATEQAANKSKLARYELINLSRQAQDVGVSLASGQALLTVAFQQGSQIFDVFASSQASAGAAIKNLGTSILGAITPARTFAAAGLAMGAAAVVSAFNWRDGQREITTALTGIGRESGATLGGINKFTVDAAANTRLYSGEARDLAVALAQTGEIGVDQFKGISELAYGASRLLGVDMAEANKILAESFADPVKGIETLGAKFGGVTAAMRQQITDLVQQGKIGEAQSIMARMFSGTAKASEQVGTLTTAWRGAMGAVDSFWDQFNKGLDRITGLNTLEDKLVMIERRLRALREQGSVESGQRVPGASVREGETGTEAKIRGTLEERAGLNVQKKLAESGLGKEIGNILSGLGELNEQGVISFTNIGNRLADMGKKLAPEIDQLREMKAVLQDLNNIDRPEVRAGMKPEQIRAAEQVRDTYKASVGFIDQAQASHRGVTAQTAVQLTLMNDQVKVAAAMGGEARLQVQEQALINQHLSQTKTLADATALAAGQINVIKAQEVAQTREALAAATDQITVAQAVTGAEQIRANTLAQIAQAQRTHGDSTEAQANAIATARAQEVAAFAQVNASVQQNIISLERQLSVVSAIGGAQRMAAQEAATYAELVDRGATAENAAGAAAAQRAVSQAQLNAGAKAQLLTLQDQHAVITASSGLDRIQAQGQATFNALLQQGVGLFEAEAVAAQQVTNAIAQANAAVEQQTHSIRQQIELLQARRDGTEAEVRAAQAYDNAIRSGADSTAAGALKAATLALEMEKAADAAARMADEAERAARGIQDANRKAQAAEGFKIDMGDPRNPKRITGTGLGTRVAGRINEWAIAEAMRLGRQDQEEREEQMRQRAQSEFESQTGVEKLLTGRTTFPAPDTTLRGRMSPPIGEFVPTEPVQDASLEAAIKRIQETALQEATAERWEKQQQTIGGKYRPPIKIEATAGITEADKITALSDLYERLSRQRGESGEEQSFLQQSIAQLMSQPFDLARDDLIKTLSDKLEQLTKSTEKLNETMQIGLDPLYSQGHDFKIGYYDTRGGGSLPSRTGLPTTTSPSLVPATSPLGLPAPPTATPAPTGGPATGTVVDPFSQYKTNSIVLTEEMLRQQRERGYYGLAEGGIMTDHGPMRINKYADGGIFDSRGGIVNSPQMFMAGEGYKPEAIIPLSGGAVPVNLRMSQNDNQRRDSNSSSVIHVNVGGVNISGTSGDDGMRLDEAQIGLEVGRHIMAEMASR